MRIGYGRISVCDRHPDEQRTALAAAACSQVFIDQRRTRRRRHPELDKALMVASRPGDQLVVTRLDRVSQSLEQLNELVDLLQQRGVDLVVLEQGIDTSTAAGRVFFTVLDTIAEFEHAPYPSRSQSWLP